MNQHNLIENWGITVLNFVILLHSIDSMQAKSTGETNTSTQISFRSILAQGNSSSADESSQITVTHPEYFTEEDGDEWKEGTNDG